MDEFFLIAIVAFNGAMFYTSLSRRCNMQRISRGTQLARSVNVKLSEKGSSRRVYYDDVTNRVIELEADR